MLLPAIWATLIFVSSFDFAQRDPSVAAAGASIENLFEIAVYAIVGILTLDTLLFLLRTRAAARPGLGNGLLISFAALALVSTAWANAPAFTFARSAQVACIVCVGYVSTAVWKAGYRNLDRDWRAIWLGFLLVIMALLASSVLFPVEWDDGRFSWMGMNAWPVGGLLALTAVIGLSMLLERSWILTNAQRWLIALLMVPTFVALALTRTRSALFGLVLGALVVMLTWSDRKQGLRPLIMPTAVVVAIAVWATLFDRIWQFLLREQTTEQFTSGTGRTRLIEPALEAFWAEPIFGQGYGAGRFLFIDEIGEWATHAHNLALELAVDLGSMGLALGFGLIAWIAISGLRLQLKDPNHVGSATLGWLGVSLLLWVADAGFALVGYSFTLLALVIAALAATSRPSARSQQTSTLQAVMDRRRRIGVRS